MTKRTTPEVETWETLAKHSAALVVLRATDDDPKATECPPWCVDTHRPTTWRIDERHRSRGVRVPLGRHQAAMADDGEVWSAALYLQLVQPFTGAGPIVQLRREECPPGKRSAEEFDTARGSTAFLELHEAGQLARVLLAAIDLAHAGEGDSGPGAVAA